MTAYDHDEVTCDAMWEIIHDTLLVGERRYCCVCEGHNCQEAIAERKLKGLPDPTEDSWCHNLGVPK